MSLLVRGPSKWAFVTSATGGAGIGFVGGEGGKIYLSEPNGNPMTYTFGAIGGGLSAGLKLPKIGKIQVRGKGVGAVIPPASFPNGGKMYVLDGCPGPDLTVSDIRGVCAFVEIGGGIIAGMSGNAMIVGMDPRWLADLVVAAMFPLAVLYLDYRMLQTATGLLVTGGLNAGLQAGAGVGAFIGGLF